MLSSPGIATTSGFTTSDFFFYFLYFFFLSISYFFFFFFLVFSLHVPDCCGNTPISSVVSGILGNSLKHGAMFEVAQEIPKHQRFTYIPPYKGQIDHLLVSHRLSTLINTSWIDHSISQETEKFMSDHWPLVVEFQSKK